MSDETGALRPELAALLALWTRARGGNALPTRGAIDPFILRPWLGHVSLIEPLAGGAFHYRLHASEEAWRFGDLTGKTTAALPPAAGEARRSAYARACAGRRPAVASFQRIDTLGGSRAFQELALPLATAADGVMILAAAWPTG